MSASQCRRPWVCMVIFLFLFCRESFAPRCGILADGSYDQQILPHAFPPRQPECPPAGRFAAGPTIAHAIATPGDSADAVDAVDAVEDSGSRTPRRGLQLLDAILAGGREGLRVVDLCRAAGLERATVYRLLSTWSNAAMWRRRGASAMADRAWRRWRRRAARRRSRACSRCWPWSAKLAATPPRGDTRAVRCRTASRGTWAAIRCRCW